MRHLFGDYVLDTRRAELHGAGVPIKRRSRLPGSAKGLSLRVPMALPSGCRA
jgi:hypothetical protein